MESTIYSITNKINKRVYIGQAENIEQRQGIHLRKLKTGKHENSQLQEDYNKYNKEAFEFRILEECDSNNADELEKFYIKELKAFEDDGGYNATTGGKSDYQFSKGYLERLGTSLKGNEKLIKSSKESWTEERKEEKSKELTKRYEDLEERRKTAEATKAGMAKMSKEDLSRKHLSPYEAEFLLEILRDIQNPETKTTQNGLVDKYDIPIALAKKLKSGKKHWIFDDIEEGKYTL